MPVNIKERTRLVVRQQLANAAFDLLLENGYDQTAEELADGLGISRATFFRHLGSKEEIVVAAIIGPEDVFADAFTQAALAPSASTWQRLKLSFTPAIIETELTPDRVRSRLTLLRATPALVSRLHSSRRPQIEKLNAAMIDHGFEPFAASVFAAAAVAVFDRCWMLWADNHELELRSLLDQAFECLEQASCTSVSHNRPD